MHDSFIMQHAFGESDELEEDMRRAFYGQFKKDIKIDDKIGVIITSSFDEKKWGGLLFEEQVPRQLNIVSGKTGIIRCAAFKYLPFP